MKVLIVDDNQKVRALLRDYLPTSVDEVFECTDGDQALAAYGKHKPDWVLMDWEMPNMNGLAATRQIIGEFPNANICMVTAFDNPELKQQVTDAGAKEFIAKQNLSKLTNVLVEIDFEN